MNLSKITSTVRAIVGTILKLNSRFDMERDMLKSLEKSLNSMGDPGYGYEDETAFDSYTDEKSNQSVDFYLAFDYGKIIVCKSDWTQGYESCTDFVLSKMSIHQIKKMLQRLPEFLSDYLLYLEGHVEAHEITIDKLSKVIQAVNAALAIKA